MTLRFSLPVYLFLLLCLNLTDVSAQALPDAEINRLFDAVIHPGSVGAPNTIDEVNQARQLALVNLYRGLFDGKGPVPDLLDVFEEGVPTRHHELVNNVQVVLPGKHLDKRIVIGAHLDQVGKHRNQVVAPQGVIDDWSGVILLLKLYEHLKQYSEENGKFHHTIVFVGFAYEESGLWGSETFVRDLEDRKLDSHVKAMVNFECLGVSDLFTWENGSTDWMEQLAESVAQTLDNTSLTRRMLGDVGADSVPFIQRGIPAITIDSLSAADFGKIHTSEDKRGNINNEKYRIAYRFAAKYIKSLDNLLAATPHLADQHETLPENTRGVTAFAANRHISWEPTLESIIDPTAAGFAFVPESNSDVASWLAIKTANRQWLEYASKGDSRGIASLYLPDATMWPPDAPVVSGRDAVQAYFQRQFDAADGNRIETTFTSRRLTVDGSIAHESGSYGNGYESQVVWELHHEAGKTVARFKFDTWRPNTLTGNADSTSSFEENSVEGNQNTPASSGINHAVLSDGIHALREADDWIIAGVRDGKMRRTRFSSVTTLAKGTEVLPQKE